MDVARHGLTTSTPVFRNPVSFPRDDGKPATKRRSSDHRVGNVIVKRFAQPPFPFHHLGAGPSVRDRPIEYASFEDIVQHAAEPEAEALSALAGSETPDAGEDFPGGDGGEANPLLGNRSEERKDARIRMRPHHFRDDVRVQQEARRRHHALPSSSNSTGR